MRSVFDSVDLTYLIPKSNMTDVKETVSQQMVGHKSRVVDGNTSSNVSHSYSLFLLVRNSKQLCFRNLVDGTETKAGERWRYSRPRGRILMTQ